MAHPARELDCVRLLRPLDGWASGTRGVVVSTYPEAALVEVQTEHLVDDEGFPLRDLFDDLVDVPYDDLEVTVPYVPSADLAAFTRQSSHG